GIRVFHVTGVQTCALPISSYSHAREARGEWDDGVSSDDHHRDLALATKLSRRALNAAASAGVSGRMGRKSSRPRSMGDAPIRMPYPVESISVSTSSPHVAGRARTVPGNVFS